MIDEVEVSNLALITHATLEPARGLTVLTGETGAGKTALLSAMQLLMGERADKLSVRDGCDELSVSGRFFFENDNELIVTRRVSSDGRSRVKMNGEMAGVNELAATVQPTIDLCGQSEHQQLTKPATHVGLLDAWIGEPVAKAKESYTQAYAQAQAAAEEVERIKQGITSNAAALDEARYVLQRIDAVNPSEEEYEELVANLGRVEHAEALAVATNTAYENLTNDGGVLDTLGATLSTLDGVVEYDASLSTLVAQLRDADATLNDAAQEVRAYRDGIDFDPATLEQQHERLAAMQGLMRVYGPRMKEVLEAREKAAELIAVVDDSDEVLRVAQRAAQAAEEQLTTAANALADVRKEYAPRFADAVTAQMQRLEMGSAQLVCSAENLVREQWTTNGSQHIEFLFKTGAGMQARPLAKIASGGEISRVMLACKVVLGASDNVDTLIFDEVDAGVGGNTANALGGVIADLAKTHQVIVVTHLAQVACFADVHYVVSKSNSDTPETQLKKLSAEERTSEIARMLSGDITEASLAHAAEILAKARV